MADCHQVLASGRGTNFTGRVTSPLPDVAAGAVAAEPEPGGGWAVSKLELQ